MKQSNILLTKSAAFAVRIDNLYKHVSTVHKDKIIVSQLLRCGTSVGANAAEADCGISKKDFLSKIYIALKEANETKYWLTLLYKTQYLTEKEYNSIYPECIELIKLLKSITKTTVSNINKN